MEKKYQGKKRSERLLERGELLDLISSIRTGVSTKALRNLTGNYLRLDFITLLDQNFIKVKKSTALSRKAVNVYHVDKKVSINRISEMELISYAVWFFRACGLRLGKVEVMPDGKVLVNAAINEEDYSTLNFVELNKKNFQWKLTNIKEDPNIQTVFVVEDMTVLKKIKANEELYQQLFKNRITIIKSSKGQEIFLKGSFNNSKLLSDNFDFSLLKTVKDKSEVEKINANYDRCKTLSERCVLPKSNKQK